MSSEASPASAAAQASPAAMDADLHVAHRQTKQTRTFFPGLLRVLRAFSGFCGPSPGFAGLLRVCVLPKPLRARSFLFFSKSIKQVEKALSTWEKPMAKNEVPYSKSAHGLFSGVSCLLKFSFFSRAVPPNRFCVGLIGSPL